MLGKSRELGNLVPGKFWHLEGFLTSKVKKYKRNGEKLSNIWGKFEWVPGKSAFFPAMGLGWV